MATLRVVEWWAALGWGCFGAIAVDLLDLSTVLRRHRCFPWQVDATGRSPLPYLVAAGIRVTLGAGFATAAAESNQVGDPLKAICAGVLAPLALERLARLLQPPSPTGNEASATDRAGSAHPELTFELLDLPASLRVVPEPGGQAMTSGETP